MKLRGLRLQKFSRGRSAQTVADQILVSASNFLTGIILVRGLGLVAFGKFTIAYVILLLANSIQLSFISSPMITLGSLCATDDERRRLRSWSIWCTARLLRDRNPSDRRSNGHLYVG